MKRFQLLLNQLICDLLIALKGILIGYRMCIYVQVYSLSKYIGNMYLFKYDLKFAKITVSNVIKLNIRSTDVIRKIKKDK